MSRTARLKPGALFAIGLLVAGCTQPVTETTGSATPAPASASPVQTVAATASPAPAAVPLGAVMFFREGTTCPEGWSELAEAKGRTILGLSPGGTLAGTVGEKLGDLEDRPHDHAVGPILATTNDAPPHVHFVDPPPHATDRFESASAPVVGALDSTKYILNSRFHDHTVDVPPFPSTSDDQHAHRVTIPQAQTTTARTSDFLPYVQLQVCRNDSATTPAMPAGATAFFTLPSCPQGWSELAEVRGRAVVGVGSDGIIGENVVGRALGDLEDRAHTHAAGALTVTTTVSEGHSHGADPASLETSAARSTSVRVQGGIGNDRHIIDAASHHHIVDPPRFDLTTVAEHSHRVAIPGREAAAASASQAMPYVQLRACQNDAPSTPAMPPGAVIFYSLAGCPAEWSEMVEARGRALVGVGSGGALLGTVGQPLGDLEDRPHSHVVGRIEVSTSSHPAHVHLVQPLPLPAVETSPSESGTARVQLFTDASAYIIGVAEHRHSFNYLSDGFNTLPAGAHVHRVPLSAIQTSVARTGQVMPYIQLLACRKS